MKNKKTMIDFIGDIHGHADELEALLKKMGYTKKNKIYSHPERKVLFVGDYIDRGPKIRKTLKIVKAMEITSTMPSVFIIRKPKGDIYVTTPLKTSCNIIKP